MSVSPSACVSTEEDAGYVSGRAWKQCFWCPFHYYGVLHGSKAALCVDSKQLFQVVYVEGGVTLDCNIHGLGMPVAFSSYS